MQAIILAGGKGTRLQPYTATFPKPLVPIGNYPVLEIIVRQLKYYGFEDLVITTSHLASLIEAYFGDGRKWGVKIKYVGEEQPLGTAGAIKLVEDMHDNALVMNGDILTTLDFREMYNHHCRQGHVATIGAHERRLPIDFGVLDVDGNGSLSNYTEKPIFTFLVSMGINVIQRRARDYIEKGESVGIPDLMLRLKAAGESIACHISNGYWLDIGRPSDYEIAQEEFAQDSRRFLPDEQ